MGSGAVFVLQVEANQKEIAGLPFADMPLTFGVVLAVVVDMAESMRTDCGLDQRVYKSDSKLSLSCVIFLVYLTTSLRLSPSGFVRVRRGVDAHRPEGHEFVGERMKKLSWMMNPDWKSVRNVRLSSQCSWATAFGWGLST